MLDRSATMDSEKIDTRTYKARRPAPQACMARAMRREQEVRLQAAKTRHYTAVHLLWTPVSHSVHSACNSSMHNTLGIVLCAHNNSVFKYGTCIMHLRQKYGQAQCPKPGVLATCLAGHASTAPRWRHRNPGQEQSTIVGHARRQQPLAWDKFSPQLITTHNNLLQDTSQNKTSQKRSMALSRRN